MPSQPLPAAKEKRRREIFEAAMRLGQNERVSFVKSKCLGDSALEEAVLRLVAAGSTSNSGSLDRPLYCRPSVDNRELPSMIGPYRVVRHLGTGGMGKVYACRDSRDNLVALKLLHPHLQTPQFLDRFQIEYKIHSRLHHPNVSRILDGGVATHGTPFIVMEHVAGAPIGTYCEHMRLTVPERLRLFSCVLAGTEYFHRCNVIHRDLKPSNILVTPQGQVKILDFGIARIVGEERGLTGLGPTQTTVPLMTARYASPEQLQQRRSGRSSDIYALGVVLYELLSGAHPFGGHWEMEASAYVKITVSTPAPPGAVVSGIPDSVNRMTLKALCFDPAKRYSTAAAFLDDLKICLEKQASAAHRG